MQPVQVKSMTAEEMLKKDMEEFAKTSDDRKKFLEQEASKLFKVYISTNDEAYYKLYNQLTQARWRQRC